MPTKTRINGRKVYEWVMSEVGMDGVRQSDSYPFLGVCRIDAAEVESRFGAGAVATAVTWSESAANNAGLELGAPTLWVGYERELSEQEARSVYHWKPGNTSGLMPGMRVVEPRTGPIQPGDKVHIHYRTVA